MFCGIVYIAGIIYTVPKTKNKPTTGEFFKMKIIEKIKNKADCLYENRQPVIAFTGDSVTQGCFELYVKEKGVVKPIFNSLESYAEKVKRVFALLFPEANITIVNAGISGNHARTGSKRLKTDVLKFNPDLTVVCYGLNDSNDKAEGLEEYKSSLRKIFEDLKNAGSEVIFMTPNMSTDRIDYSIKEEEIQKAAERVSKTVNEGWLEKYIEEAKSVCKEEDIPVCDCYSLWKKLDESGIDITRLLSNKLNHPIKEMHWMFAYELVKTMFN